MKCPFCNIDEEKTRIIKDNNSCYVCFSNPKITEGHLLIIPKRHVEKLSELNKVEREDLFNLVIEYQEKILKNIAKGCDIRQNYRPFQKQDNLKVNHLHIHLQPREFEDELYEKSQIFEKNLFRRLTKEEIKKINKFLD